MKPRRLAVVCRRYWPATGEQVQAIEWLAEGLRRAGHEVTILTAALGKQWPTHVVHREVKVERLAQLHLQPWNTLTYLWSLLSHLRTHKNQFDAVIVSGLRYDAYAVVRALRGTSLPVFLWSEGAGIGGDIQWQQNSHFGARVVGGCFDGQALFCTSQVAAEELLAHGAPPEKIVRLSLGITPFPERTIEAKIAARKALGDVNHDLLLDQRSPLAIYHGPLAAGLGLEELVSSWRGVQAKLPTARLWLVGDGDLREKLWNLITDLDLRYRVCMPGVFDDLTELLAAADALVMPHLTSTSHTSMIPALAAGLPVVAGDVPTSRELISHAQEGLLVSAQNLGDMSEAITTLISDPLAHHRFSMLARESALRRFDLGSMIKRIVDVIETTIPPRNSR